jgi:hypothetical protein
MPLAKTDWSAFGPQLDPTLALQQVNSQRYNSTWYQATVCPNRMVEKADHNLNCTVCNGLGHLYDAGTTIKMLVTSVSIRQMWATQGRVDLGMAMITTPPETTLSWWDKVTFNEATIRYTEVVQHQPINGLTDKLKYGIVDSTNLNKRGVLRLVRQDGVDLTLDTDFSVVNGCIVWATDPGSIFYSVLYFARPSYIIIDVNHQFRALPAFGKRGINVRGPERTVEFPVMALGKLDFLVGDESKVSP